MSNLKLEKDKDEFIREINIYKKERPKFVLLSKVLLLILKKIVSQVNYAIVQTRAKEVVSFAEKIQRPGKKHKYGLNPIEDLTDLCGGRCIFPTLKDVDECCDLIEQEFTIIWEHSEDKLAELGVSRFGYLSKHYIIQLNLDSPILQELTFQKKDSCTDKDSGDKITFENYSVIERVIEENTGKYDKNGVSGEIRKQILESLENLCSEIQVRTLLQHAWSDIGHDKIYKANFQIPKNIQRSFNRISAVLENTDVNFQKMIDELDMYVKNYGAYMTEEEMNEEIERLKIVIEIATDLKKVERFVYRIVSLARCIEKWEETITILDSYSQKVKLTPRLNREYGLALSKVSSNIKSEQFIQAREKLEAAIRENPKDSDAYSILGGWWKKKGDLDKALKYYEKAYTNDPDDSYAVGNYFILEISHNKNYKILKYSKPIFKNVISKCETEKEIGINIPWVYFDLGLFYLFLGKIVKAMNNYLIALRYTNARWMINTTLNTINLLYEFKQKIPGLKLVKRLLLLGLAFRFNDKNAIEELEKLNINNEIQLKAPLIIIAGRIPSTHTNIQREINNSLMKIFHKTPFSLISNAKVEESGNITASPNSTLVNPLEKIEIPLKNYGQSESSDSFIENIKSIIQYWCRIILNRLKVKDIKLIGLGGTPISLFEYRTALIFGCQVGVFKDIWGNSQLFEDKNFKPSKIYTEEEIKTLSETEKLKIESQPIRLFDLKRERGSLVNFFNYSYNKSPV
jgi:ppGpp synthetase/RelA/SpoT-type nucleotidyltranferase